MGLQYGLNSAEIRCSEVAKTLGVSIDDIKSHTPIVMNFHTDSNNGQHNQHSNINDSLIGQLTNQLQIKDSRISQLLEQNQHLQMQKVLPILQTSKSYPVKQQIKGIPVSINISGTLLWRAERLQNHIRFVIPIGANANLFWNRNYFFRLFFQMIISRIPFLIFIFII